MPNNKGTRKPNGTWSEDTPERRAQKAAAAARLRARRRDDQAWQETTARQKAESRARQDPNKAREQKQEKRFRDAAHTDAAPQLLLATVNRRELKRPALYFLDNHGRLHREDYRSAERLIEEECTGGLKPARETEEPCPSPKPS